MAGGSYSYITQAQAVAQLAALLDDPSSIYWSAAELGVYLTESIRTFSGLSRFYRARASFPLSPTVPFYDLPKLIPQRSYNVRDTDIIAACAYHLIEPQPAGNPLAWTGTDQFALSDIADAVTRRVNQFLLDTECTISIVGGLGLTWDEATMSWDALAASWDSLGLGPMVPITPPSDRVPLPDNVIAIRHANWADSFGNRYSLWPDDQWSIDSGANSAAKQTPGRPAIYSVSETPALTMRLSPPPSQTGILELVTVNAAGPFNPATGATLGIPDDYAWAVKWGVLADLLGDGQARDPLRSNYCQARYEEGVLACRAGSSVLDAQLNGAPFWMGPYTQMQNTMPRWRAQLKKPTVGAMLGQNLLAFGPVPDQPYGASMDVVANAVVPTGPGEFLQVGREEFGVVLQYARHLACFKMGGQEFIETMDGWQRMVKLGLQMNGALRAQSRNLAAMRDLALIDRQFQPDRIPSPELEQRQQQAVGANQ